MNKEKDMNELIDKLNSLFNEYGYSIDQIYRKPSLDFIKNETIYIDILPTELKEVIKID